MERSSLKRSLDCFQRKKKAHEENRELIGRKKSSHFKCYHLSNRNDNEE